MLALLVLAIGRIAQAAPAVPTGLSPGSGSSPGPTESGTSVNLSWGASTGATSYGLGIRDIASGSLVVNTTVTGSTTYSASLAAGKQYRWNVNACSSAGCSSYAADLYFQTPAAVSIPAVPTSLSPGSGSSPGPTESGTSITLSWGASAGATSYGLGVRDIASGSLVVNTTVTGSTAYSATLTAGKQYRWNVNACSSAGCSSYAADLYFQTPAAVSIPAVPTSLSPGSGSSPGPTESGNFQHNPELGRLRGSDFVHGLGVRDIGQRQSCGEHHRHRKHGVLRHT